MLNKTKNDMIKKYFTLAILILLSLSCKSNLPKNETKAIPYYEFAFYEIVRREGVQLSEYTCPAGYRTVGIGQRIYSDTNIPTTLESARKAAQNELQTTYNYVEKKFPKLVHHQKLAVSLFVYNFGKTFFEKSDLYQELKKNGDINSTWKKYVYFRNKNTHEMQKSDNLKKSRLTELAIFNADEDFISDKIIELKENAVNAYIKAKTNKS